VSCLQHTDGQHTGSNTQAEQAARSEVNAKLKEIQNSAEKSREEVVEELVRAVCTVEPKLHINVLKAQKE